MLFIDGSHVVGKTRYWLPEVKATESSGDTALPLQMRRTAAVTAHSPCGPDSPPMRSLGRRS
jgi:hypothetical protein